LHQPIAPKRAVSITELVKLRSKADMKSRVEEIKKVLSTTSKRQLALEQTTFFDLVPDIFGGL
jgi:hypothetical protein